MADAPPPGGESPAPFVMWDEDPPDPDPSFRRQLWASFALFALLVMVALGVLTRIYMGALRDKALSMALEKGQERADDMARMIQEEVEQGRSDIYTIVRDRKEVDAVLGDRSTGRKMIESWWILDPDGRTIASSHEERPAAPRPPSATGGEEPVDSRQILSVEKTILLGGKKAGLLRLFLSEPDLMRQVEDFQRDVRMKVLLGAGATLALLLVGFLYVLRLLERTRRIHDQAEARLRLASLGSLAGGLAHEIRNPLNAMNMNVQLLEEDIAASGADQQDAWRATLRTTRQEIRRLDDLVTNVLTYARPLEPVAAPIALRPLFEELRALLQPELARARTEIAIDAAGDLVVQAEGGRLRQALLNVLRNAIQAIESRGSGGRIRIAATRDGGSARIEIEDDGPGIPPEDRPHLFTAFASRKPGGTGLGLPIARKILRAHAGDLLVEEGSPRGTRVVMTLPTRSTSSTSSNDGHRVNPGR